MRDDNELLTAEEVAKLLKVPKSWVYEKSSPRQMDPLPHVRLGKYLRFSRRDVLAYLEERKLGASGVSVPLGRA